jgi:hypothetical protein
VPIPSVTTAAVDASQVGRPPIHSRAEWGADERLMIWPPQYALTVRALAWHDQSVGGEYSETDVPRILRALFYYHAVTRGWGDLGDNVLVDRFGRLWEGRYGGLSRAVIGAHASARNAGTAGIGVLGGPAPVETSTQSATPAVEAAARYVAWKLSIGPAVDPRGYATLSPTAATGSAKTDSAGAAPPKSTSVTAAPKTTKAIPRSASGRSKPAATPTPSTGTVPVVFAADQAAAEAVLPTIRDRAYALMGAWARPQTMRRTLAMWNPARATLTELGDTTAVWAGQPGDRPVPADYDGDGQLDIATWSPATGVWTIQNSSAGTTESFVLGQPNDTPVPAD